MREDSAVELNECVESLYDLLRSKQMLWRSADSEEQPLLKPGNWIPVERKRKRKGILPTLEPKIDGPNLTKNDSQQISG